MHFLRNTLKSSLCGPWEAQSLAFKSVKVPVCPLTGVYVRNVPAPDLPCEHSTPVLTLPGLSMPQIPGGACSQGEHVLKPGG